MRTSKAVFVTMMLAVFVLLSGCTYKSYHGCALWPTDTPTEYTVYNQEEQLYYRYKSEQSWWEYKKGYWGPLRGFNETDGNAPWWIYPTDFICVPLYVGTMSIYCALGGKWL